MHFIPLSEEEMNDFKKFRQEVYKDEKWAEEEENVLYSYKNGEIEFEEYNEKLRDIRFNKTGIYLSMFEKKYHFIPYKAGEWEVAAF